MKQRFRVGGMSCAACSAHVEKSVSAVPGVSGVQVNLLAGSMAVEYDENACDAQTIIKAVESGGYTAAVDDGRQTSAPAQSPQADEALKEMKTRIIVSAIFMLVLMYFSMGEMVGLPLPSYAAGMDGMFNLALTELLLTLPIVVINRKYYINGFKTLLHRAPTPALAGERGQVGQCTLRPLVTQCGELTFGRLGAHDPGLLPLGPLAQGPYAARQASRAGNHSPSGSRREHLRQCRCTAEQRQQTLQRQRQVQQQQWANTQQQAQQPRTQPRVAEQPYQQPQTRTAQTVPVQQPKAQPKPAAQQPYQDLLQTPAHTTAAQPKTQPAAPITNETQPPKQTAEKKDERRWMVQCGSFKGAEQAETVRAQLAFEGFASHITTNNGWNRVVIGPVKGKENADGTISRLKVAGHTNCIRLASGG